MPDVSWHPGPEQQSRQYLFAAGRGERRLPQTWENREAWELDRGEKWGPR